MRSAVMIYLDYAATNPMTDEVLKIYHQVSKSFFGNPSSLHDYGSKISILLKKSREKLSTLSCAVMNNLDYAATSPMTYDVLQIYHQVSKSLFVNPSIFHDTGSKASLLLEKSREELATLLSGLKSGIYFTGGGSEAN